PLVSGLLIAPWEWTFSLCASMACGRSELLLFSFHCSAAPAIDTLSLHDALPIFLVGDDPKEELIRRDDWIVGNEEFRWRMHQQADRQATRRRWRQVRAR